MNNFFNIYKDDSYSQNRLDDYSLWIKKLGLQLYKANPPIYAVSKEIKIDTPDGPMLSVKIVKDILNPKYEPIAEININNILYYIYDDHLYGVGVRNRFNTKGSGPERLVRQIGNTAIYGHQNATDRPFETAIRLHTADLSTCWFIKMVIYKIGSDPFLNQ